jgi:hypothetical protein
VILAGLLALPAAGCSLHLHRPADAKQAQTAIETYDKVSFDGVVKTARDNAAALDKAEGDAIQQLTELVIRRDLAGLITEVPVRDADLPRGWFKLIGQIKAELGPLGILDGSGTRVAPGTAADAQRLTNRITNREYVTSDRANLDLLVRDYTRGPTPGTQPTRCDYPVPAKATPQAVEQIMIDIVAQDPPPMESPRKWRFYRTLLVPTCAAILKKEAEADLAVLMMTEHAYKDLADKVNALETDLGVRDGTAKRLRDKYSQAKAAFEATQTKLADLTISTQTDKAKAELPAVQKAAADLSSAITDARKIPYVEAWVKTDLVTQVIANLQAAGGRGGDAANATTKQFLTLLQEYPDVAARLRAGATPSMNVLLMELTIQRLALRRATVERDKIADEVNLLRAQRDLRVERAAAWLRVADTVQGLTSVPALESRPLVGVYAGSNDGKEKARIEDVLQAYAFTRLKYELLDASLTFQERQRERAYAMDMNEVALITWRDFIRAPLQEISTYHEGGIRSEDLANLIQAIGMAGITAGLSK